MLSTQITSFYGQTQFQNRFGEPNPSKPGTNYSTYMDGIHFLCIFIMRWFKGSDYSKLLSNSKPCSWDVSQVVWFVLFSRNEMANKSISTVTAPWQSGLSNSALVGQLAGLVVNSYTQDRFGNRPTMMVFMTWMACMIFIPVFAPSLPVLAFGEAMCGISWGVFQTLSTTYACEVVPTVLRPYVTAYVCMCWGAGILLSSGVVRAVAGLEGNLGWRLPFVLQWVWPIPLFIGAYLAPESPWNSVRRDKIDEARKNLKRLRQSNSTDFEIEATLAYIQHTTAIEKAETENASYKELFQGSNLRRTEIVSAPLPHH